jgi:hypothetical protein
MNGRFFLEITAHPRFGLPLVVRDLERFDFVPVDSIDWIESADNYVMLHCGVKNRMLEPYARRGFDES